MTNPDAGATRRDLAHAAERTSDASADLWASLTGLGRSIRAAHTAGVSIPSITRELRQGRTDARERRGLARIRPSVRLAAHSAEVIAAAAASGLTDVQIFGSCVRGEDTCSSDVDLIVTISEHTSLFDITRFALAVEDLLSLDEGRADVATGDVLRPGSDSGARIAAEAQPLTAWAAGWPRLDSLPGWPTACAAGATEEELVEAAEIGLRRWGPAYTELRYRPETRPAGATMVDPLEVTGLTVVLDRYAAGRGDGLDHGAAIARVVITPRPA